MSGICVPAYQPPWRSRWVARGYLRSLRRLEHRQARPDLQGVAPYEGRRRGKAAPCFSAAQLQERWAAAKCGAVSLSHKEITALAGIWYRDLVMDHQDEPGNIGDWTLYQDFLRDGLVYFDPEGDGIKRAL